MIFPIGDVNVKGASKPVVTYILIGINIAVFAYQLTLTGPACNQFVYKYGAVPYELVHLQDWFTAWTSMFLHGGFMHIIGNMLFLWVFADNIEAILGKIPFFIFYMAGGLAAAILQTALNPASRIPMVGASGAISACLGAYIVMFPRSKIRVLIVFFFTSIYVPAILFLGVWIIQQFIAGYGAIAKTSDTGGVAYWAHIGGFLFGVLVGFLYKKRAGKYS